MASFVLRPSGTYVGELDLALQAKAISTSIGAAVITSRRGPEYDKFVTRVELFDAVYGPPDASWSFAHYCMRQFLRYGQGAWITRVTNAARHAGGMMFNDRGGSLAVKTLFKPFSTGRYDDYKSGSQNIYNFQFSSPVLPGQQIAVEFRNDLNVTSQTVSATYEANSDNTLDALAKALQTALNAGFTLPGKSKGQAFVNTIGVLGNDDRLLTVVAPEDQVLDFTRFVITRGTGDTTSVLPVVTEYDDSLVFDVYAENRGKWASDPASQGVGYRISNVDNGTHERILIQFSQALTATQQASLKFQFADPTGGEIVEKTIAIAPIGAGAITDHAAAIAYFMGEFKRVFPGSDAYLLDNNPLQVVLVAPEAGKNTLTLENYFVDDGSANAPTPLITSSEYLEGIASSQTFDFEIYTRDDINSPKETRTVSLVRQTDGNGAQLYIEDVLNNNSTTKSNYIRVKHNQNNLSAVLNVGPEGTPIYWLGGGDDGVIPTSGDIIRTWDNYKDRQFRPARIFINCGYTALSVQQKMTSLSKARYDVISVLDFPSDKQEVQAAFEYRQNAMNLNSSYAAIYLPDIRVSDEINNKELFIPPSGHVAAVYANTDNVAASWFAPAGLNRAIIEDALGLRVEYNADDMGLLISGQLNPIINRGGDIVIWEQFTAYRKTSPFQNVSLRRMLILIEVSVVDGLDYTIHEPNDDYTGMLIVQIAVSILQPIKQGRGLFAYAAISDDRNNSTFDYDRQNRNLDLLMDPILPIRTIQLTSVITNRGASFAEVLNALSGNLATSAQ